MPVLALLAVRGVQLLPALPSGGWQQQPPTAAGGWGMAGTACQRTVCVYAPVTKVPCVGLIAWVVLHIRLVAVSVVGEAVGSSAAGGRASDQGTRQARDEQQQQQQPSL